MSKSEVVGAKASGADAWFAKNPSTLALGEVLAKYSLRAVLQGLVEGSDATHADVEVLLCVLAQTKPGKIDEMPPDERDRALHLAHSILDTDIKGLGPLMMGLKVVREARPAWFSGPLYAELLAPFSDLVVKEFGRTPQQLFDSATHLSDVRGESIPVPGDLPEGLVRELTIELGALKTPADLRNKVLVRFNDDWSYALGYNAAEAIYRVVVRSLAESSPTFGTRKGKALEDFVRRRLERLAPSWTFLQGLQVEGKEKDLLAWDDDAAIAVECKGLRIRGSAADWSVRNLESDVKVVEEALAQLKPSLQLLGHGGSIQGTTVPSREIVQGLVITDESFTAFVRGGLDRLGIDDHPREWHGRDVWIGSFLDLDYLATVAETISVFLHYLRQYRSDSAPRHMDETEAWSAYAVARVQSMRKFGVQVTITEHDWDKSRKDGIESFSPQWLQRTELVKQFDSRRSAKKALRVIEQDLTNAIRKDRKQLEASRQPKGPAEQADIETIVQSMQRMEAERETQPKAPYRSL